jgi:hypothetical protein
MHAEKWIQELSHYSLLSIKSSSRKYTYYILTDPYSIVFASRFRCPKWKKQVM